MTVPSLDHYYGRNVEAVEQVEDGGWYIQLEGDVKIINLNELYEMPDQSLVGSQFSRSAFSNDMTRLWFGDRDNPQRIVMMLDPMTYMISDPNFNNGDPISPQARVVPEADEFEMSAPGNRVAEKPDDEFVQSEEERKADEAERESKLEEEAAASDEATAQAAAESHAQAREPDQEDEEA